MMITNDPQAETPFVLKERRPFALLLTLEKQDKSRVDLTGCAASLIVSNTRRNGGGMQIENIGTIVSAAHGTIQFFIVGEDLNFGVGTYDMVVRLTTAEGFDTSIIEGPLELTHNPDPSIPDAPGPVVPPLSLTARLLDQNRVTVRVNHHPDSVLLDALTDAQAAANQAGIYRDEAEAAAAAAEAARDAAQVLVDTVDVTTEDLTGYVDAAHAWATAAAASAAAANTSATTASGHASAADNSRSQAQDAYTDAQFEATSASVSAGNAAASAAEAAALLGEVVRSDDIDRIERMTQAEYDALDPKVATTLYVIVG